MGGIARAVTNSVGNVATLQDSHIGDGGHGVSADQYKKVEYANHEFMMILDLNKTLRLVKIKEALLEFGYKLDDVIKLYDDAKITKRLNKKGKWVDIKHRPKHYSVAIKVNGKNALIVIGNDVLKIGIKKGESYEFYRSVENVKRLLK